MSYKSQMPLFDDLPLDKSGPKLNAWGLYGAQDQLGALNRLTPDTVTAAAKSEIQTGHRINLDLPLDVQGNKPFFNRAAFHQQLLDKAPRMVNDDIWTFNTQSSSQWDGLRHFAYQSTGQFYNGATQADIHRPGSTTNGIGAWAAQGIVGRGVLLDWHAWRQATGATSAPHDKHDYFRRSTPAITAADLRAVAEWQGTSLRFGDVLFVRSGWTAAWRAMSGEELAELKRDAGTGPPAFIGVEQSEDTLRWVWEHFAAVAGDQPSFEAWPTRRDWSCHEVFLSGWGMPIGELFDLDGLAEHCAREKRWSFFLTSEPCNVPGGVASPPNALAIF